MLDHLICDCDGVLVDSEVIADRVLLDTLSATFPNLDFEAAAKSAFGQQTSRFLTGIESRFGIEMPANFIETIEHNIEIALAQSLTPISGVRDALLKVTLPAAVVSNSRLVRVRNSLKRASLTEIFASGCSVPNRSRGRSPTPTSTFTRRTRSASSRRAASSSRTAFRG